MKRSDRHAAALDAHTHTHIHSITIHTQSPRSSSRCAHPRCCYCYTRCDVLYVAPSSRGASAHPGAGIIRGEGPFSGVATHGGVGGDDDREHDVLVDVAGVAAGVGGHAGERRRRVGGWGA